MMTKTCLWTGTGEAAAFHGMKTNLYHCMSKTCEIAILRKSCILDDNRTSGRVTQSVPKVKVERYKTNAMPEWMRLYPHCTTPLLCPIFALAYSFIMSSSPADFFPIMPIGRTL